ncbi:MAG: hypothetical protein CJBNEKGG_02870 [Prosthecobacter sp.]|nr:hypothetical protein [Prosthecobacter sp.]
MKLRAYSATQARQRLHATVAARPWQGPAASGPMIPGPGVRNFSEAQPYHFPGSVFVRPPIRAPPCPHAHVPSSRALPGRNQASMLVRPHGSGGSRSPGLAPPPANLPRASGSTSCLRLEPEARKRLAWGETSTASETPGPHPPGSTFSASWKDARNLPQPCAQRPCAIRALHDSILRKMPGISATRFFS